MNVDIHQSWKPFLETEFNKPYFSELVAFVKHEYQQHTCYPPGNAIFNAFNQCHFNDVKVVIIGQDPYHGPNQANGLCFSVHEGVAHPPSLINIFKEIETDLGVAYPKSGNLIRWSQQGVLLLNATLTVRAHEAGSHQKQGWETFTDAVIKTVSTHANDVVFLLWGGFAKKKVKLIDKAKHHILTSGHPSPLSANRGYWFGNKHFSKTNALLKKVHKTPIKW
ncbi:uracil-DNA glycosylase [Seonamhaeicola algicola]|uniref:Uracil-DNA glycosylase n=1 Tax=Seonamhaeicola algicola TaxID=1719036 RepID=A0A5C7B5E5_9FLAO|nr:uracil-DNA glycosylase [Seonamhaeicola algicola]TXE15133.1 uracil-DNA glycosylase [Seonamhaeicola algicola]